LNRARFLRLVKCNFCSENRAPSKKTGAKKILNCDKIVTKFFSSPPTVKKIPHQLQVGAQRSSVPLIQPHPRTMKKTLFAVLGLAVVSLAGVNATVLLSDDFPTDGALVGQTPAVGGIWTANTGTAGTLLVSNNQLEISASRTEDAFSSFGNQTVDLYAGFVLNMSSSLPSSSGTHFATFMSGAAGTTANARLFSLTSGAGSGFYRLGIANSGTTASFTWGSDLSPNVSYQVVFKFTQNGASDFVSLWIDPINELSTSISTASEAITTNVNGFGFRQNTGSGNMTIDNLRVGTTFAEAIPEPSTWALIGLGAAFVLWRIRRRRVVG
jgi:hypothetical protein